jgi:serine/threonine protein kinase
VQISEQFTIKERLGKQAVRKFGDVFLVEDKSTSQRAILKAVKKAKGSDIICARIRQEATFSFDEDGLPTTLRFEETDQEILYIRKFADGLPLDLYWSTLKRRERLSFIIELLKQLHPLFESLKKHEIVHCDLKPSNLLIETTGVTIKVHLLDFGLAIRKQELENRSILFPLGFAAPELLLNQLDLVDTTTDIYALGITLWRLYTGKLPLGHPNPSVFTNLQLTHPLPEHSDVPKRIYKVLLKMTHKHSFKLPPNRMKQADVREALKNAIAQRPQNLREVIDALEEIDKRRWW